MKSAAMFDNGFLSMFLRVQSLVSLEIVSISLAELYSFAFFSMYFFNFRSEMLYPVLLSISALTNGIRGLKNIFGNPVLSEAIYNMSFYKSLKGLSKTIPLILACEHFDP
jgi:hypothetical protein